MFKLGNASLYNLVGVHPKLVACTNRAIEVTLQDFAVHEGLRSRAQEAINVRNGTSKTMNSEHIVQPDGFGHAVDLVPWINGAKVWDWTGCYLIAMAMDQAATEQGVARNIRWGGAWDRRLSDFGGDVHAYQQAVLEYRERHPGPDFLDGPHFEWRL